MPEFRILTSGDEVALESFLVAFPDTSLQLRSNLRAAGLVDRGRHLEATYAAAIEEGRVVAVAAHCWNGNLLVLAPSHVAEVARLAVQRAGRPVAGLFGPWPEVVAAREALSLTEATTTTDSRDVLYTLDLEHLRVPLLLLSGEAVCRLAVESESPLLTQWRVDFAFEALGASDSVTLRAASRETVESCQASGDLWLLTVGERPVACSILIARVPEAVVVGGVWTPPEFRGLGYARAVVAGSLDAVRQRGVRRAVLFADRANASSRAAYEAIGFVNAGDFGVVLFADPGPTPHPSVLRLPS
ncbi:MAG: GNAT family N-acetyltransferase, partial [Gemmatimonadales bacterium]